MAVGASRLMTEAAGSGRREERKDPGEEWISGRDDSVKGQVRKEDGILL